VAVARAVVGEPALVLADEPTANLDSATGDALLRVMERLNHERGVTFIFSTHDPRVMERAHRLVHLVDGRIASDVRQAVHRGQRDGNWAADAGGRAPGAEPGGPGD